MRGYLFRFVFNSKKCSCSQSLRLNRDRVIKSFGSAHFPLFPITFPRTVYQIVKNLFQNKAVRISSRGGKSKFCLLGVPVVNDFQVSYLDDILNVTWSPPNGGESCSLTYGILIRNNTQLVLTTTSFAVEDRIPSCVEATVAVWPIHLGTFTGPMTWGVYERGINALVHNFILGSHSFSCFVHARGKRKELHL